MSIFLISIVAGLSILVLTLISVLSREFQFWPPPSTDTWQHRTILILIRVLFLGLVILSFQDYNSLEATNLWLRYVVGLPLLVLGFGAAFHATFVLGWKFAHGEKREELKTTGWYSWSRNPIYVVSIAGMVGWGLFVNSMFVFILLAMWALFYVVAPFIEEPWLQQHYGEIYDLYKAKVPRFIGIAHKKT